LPSFEGLNRGLMDQVLLRQMLVVQPSIPKQGFLQILPAVKMVRVEHLIQALINGLLQGSAYRWRRRGFFVQADQHLCSP